MKQQSGIQVIFGITFTLVLSAGTVMAQMDPGSGSPPRDNKSRAASKTSDPENDRKTSNSDPQPSQAEELSKPAEKPVQLDQGSRLREQIESASNGQEKGRLQLKLVDQLVSDGKNQDALSELHKMVGEDRFDPQGFYNAGNALARLGDSNGAVSAYRKAIEQRKGRYSKALNNLAVVLMRQGHWYEAHYNLTQALRLESFHYAEASYNLGRLYATQGQMDLAIREWRRALSVNPNHSAATQAMLRARIEDVITVSSQQANKGTSGLKGSNEPGTATTNIGSAGSLPTASSAKDLRIDPVTYSHLQRARSARERGKNEEALKHYRVVISRLGGYFGPANLELSYVLIALMQQDAALDNLRALTSKDGSRYPVGFYHLGRIYEARGDFEEAAEAFGQAARYYADANPQFLLDVSRVREKLGDYNRALAALQEYLAAMERQGMKPQWAEERLAALRQKAAAAQK